MRNVVLLLLAGAAGCVDAVSYVGLGRVFTANMTGNTVLLGLAVGQAEGLAVLRSSLALVGFVAGVGIGAAFTRRARPGQVWPPGATGALALEWALLLAFAALWVAAADSAPGGRTAGTLIVLSSLAMGIQSAVARRLDVSGIATTYITGTLTTLACSAVDRARGAVVAAASREPGARVASLPAAWSAEALLAATWVVYVGGAAVVAAAGYVGPGLMLGFPVVLMTAAIGAALLRLRSS
jgi:uncharacterized membrane protein YoaK (UPF0700 family)